MIKEKIAATDQISFILNGKPVEVPKLICPKCGVDRYKEPCPEPGPDCPIQE